MSIVGVRGVLVQKGVDRNSKTSHTLSVLHMILKGHIHIDTIWESLYSPADN